MQPLALSPDAPWKARFRAAAFWQSTIAPHSPTHGLVTSNRSGTLQWYAWDVPSGALRQLTAAPGGHASPLTLAPNGSYVYFLQDKDGNEIGHYVRFPYAGERRKISLPACHSIQPEVVPSAGMDNGWLSSRRMTIGTMSM